MKLSTSGHWLLDNSSDNFFSLLLLTPGRGWLMVKLCSFYSWIMAPTVLTGTYKILEIMRCFVCDTSVMRHLFIGHQSGLNQLILICTDKGQDCFVITDRFQLVSLL